MQDAGGPASELELIVAQVVAAYDRQIEASCPCFVEMGAYPSVEECVKWQASGPDWVPCTSRVLARYDSEGTRGTLRCYAEQTETRIGCLATKTCDVVDRAWCDTSPIACVMEGALEAALALSTECPDVLLLQRQ